MKNNMTFVVRVSVLGPKYPKAGIALPHLDDLLSVLIF